MNESNLLARVTANSTVFDFFFLNSHRNAAHSKHLMELVSTIRLIKRGLPQQEWRPEARKMQNTWFGFFGLLTGRFQTRFHDMKFFSAVLPKYIFR